MKLTLEECKARMDANGGSLDLSGTGITDTSRVARLQQGDYVPGRYLYADGILTHLKSTRRLDGYNLYIGKIPGQNVVSDGECFAHCKTLRDGVADILFKKAADRGAEQYRGLTADSVITKDEAITMFFALVAAVPAFGLPCAASVLHKDLGLSQQAKIRKWVLACCACYRILSLLLKRYRNPQLPETREGRTPSVFHPALQFCGSVSNPSIISWAQIFTN